MRIHLALAACLASFALGARADVPRVITDVPAVHSLTAQVMGHLGTPDILLGENADPHHFQLRPSQARALGNADLVIWVGPELTPWLDRALHGMQPGGEVIELIHLPQTHVRAFGDQDEHDAETAHGQDEHDEHDHEGTDPHAWLSPENGAVWLDVIADTLARLDPENAGTYAANAQAAQQALMATEARIRDTLAPVDQTPIVVFHDAYGYFADHFGLNVAGAIALGDAANPGAKRLSSIHKMLRDEGVVCIFPEAQHDPAYVASVVGDTGTRVGAPLDPSGTNLPYGPDLYAALLTGLADTIAACVTAQ